MKARYATAIALLIILAVVEGAAFLTFQLRPMATPLAFPSGEGRLHLFVPQETSYYYGIKPNYRQTFRASEFSTKIRTNNRGFRMDMAFNGEPLDLATAGDSFTFGHGVNVGERFTDLVAGAFPGRRVTTLAPANGAAPADYYLFLKDHPEVIPRVLVVGLFPWNDLRDDISSVRLIHDASGELVRIERTDIAVNPEGYLVARSRANWVEPRWRKWMREFNAGRLFLIAGRELAKTLSFYFDETDDDSGLPLATRPAALSRGLSPFEMGNLDADARTSLGYLRSLADLMRRHGGRLLVMYIPASYMVGDYPWLCEHHSGMTAEQCGALRSSSKAQHALAGWFDTCLDMVLLDLTEDFRALEQAGRRMYFEIDAHWTRAGHTAAAGILAERLKSLGWLELARQYKGSRPNGP